MDHTIPPSLPPASREDADRWLWERAKGVVDAHLSTREAADFARQVKSMIEKTAYEYGGRFLYELIQNGYDRNDPASTDGVISFVLDRGESEFGVLYVANTGSGFTESNVRAIANLGLSDKEMGVDVGNKGVGFKSVLQICDSPEIYSTLPTGVPGFCFRFAREGDIPGFVGDDPTKVRHVLEELSLYSITVPTDSLPPRAVALWAEGFSSVIRLPLREGASELVAGRLANLSDSRTPVLLFLPRLREISITYESPNDEPKIVGLRRKEESLAGNHFHCRACRVTLDNDVEFFAFTRQVEPTAATEAIEAAIHSHRLDPKWRENTEGVEVSIAVPVSAPHPIAGRFYTYLPLGDKAPSPFVGHVHAPFATNLARLDVDHANPFNALLMQEVAGLCLDSAELLRERPDINPDTVVDLVRWNSQWIGVISREAERGGTPLIERRLLPTIVGSWASVSAIWRWPNVETSVLTANLATESCDIPLLREMDAARKLQFDAFLESLDLRADPDGDELATWVEVMLGDLLDRNRPLQEWDQAYEDLAKLFRLQPDALRARRILLTDDWELRLSANVGRQGDPDSKKAATPFFHPARLRVDEEEDVDPDADVNLPKSVARRLFYVHGGLSWYANRLQTPARAFLQNNRLVRRFDTRSIFEHLRSLLTATKSPAVFRDALRLAFNLDRSSPANQVNLYDLGLRVPTMGGTWIHASSALFSSGWPGTSGEDLSLIAGTPSHRSTELSTLKGRLLPRPEGMLNKGESTEAWTDFLARAGVSDVMPLHEVSDERSIWGRFLAADQLAEVPALPESVRAQWRKALPSVSWALYPETPYKQRSPLYWLPGQGDWDELAPRVQEALCRQILKGLQHWSDVALTVSWERDRSGDKDRRSFATPLAAFLSQSAWLPTQRPGQPDVTLVSPRKCWTFSAQGGEVPPRFATFLIRGMRDEVNDNATALRRLRKLGVGVWGSPEDADRLVGHLGDLLNSGAVTEIYLSQFRNLYQKAWAECAAKQLADPFPSNKRSYLVVDSGGALTTIELGKAGTASSVPDIVVASADDDRSLLRLLADFRIPVLSVGARPREVAALLSARLNKPVGRATDISPTVFVDGREFTPVMGAESPPLVGILPALPALVATLLESRRGVFTHLGQRGFEDALDALRRVRYVAVDRVEVTIGDVSRPLPARLQGVLPVQDSKHPSLIVDASARGPLAWPLIDALAEPLMYLAGRPELATELRLAVTRLQAANVPLDDVDDEDIAAACEVPLNDVRAIAQRIESSITYLLERLYPVVAHLGGIDEAGSFDPEDSPLTTESDVRESLAALGSLRGVEAHRLLAAALSVTSVDALRRELGIPLEAFNMTLKSLVSRQHPIDYGQEHADTFSDYVRRTNGRILDRIRWARWSHFECFDPQTDWRDLRRPTSLTPDREWALTRDSLSTAELEARVEEELTRLVGSPLPVEGPSLTGLAACQKSNADLITASAPRIGETVRAWLTARGQRLFGIWSALDSVAGTLLDDLDRVGALDFAVLESADLIRWIAAVGHWPKDMPHSIDPDLLGLTAEDLDDQRSVEAQQRAEATRVRRTVYLDDEPFDLDSGMTEFRAALNSSLAATPDFLAARGRFASLRRVATGAGQHVGPNGGAGGRSLQPRLSDPQREAIGFAGEWFAYKWLEQVHQGDFSPDCWVSGYRREAFPGSGDDSLGWDFVVPTRRGLLMYEVKTTQGEGGQVELGETQVLAAQKHARNDRWRLLVITHVLNEKRRIHMLRNPFHPDARGQYGFVGQGLKLRFNLNTLS